MVNNPDETQTEVPELEPYDETKIDDLFDRLTSSDQDQ
jgi:hypothetical protein